VKRSTILYLIASGIVAYLYGFPTNGLSHFDEGQYAFARVWPWIDKFDVDQAFFSPPLFPFLVGLVQHLPITRPDLASVYISHIACWLSLFFAVRLAVAWWGEDAALPTFALLLLSPMRLAFGSIGLTDALFSALFLATLLAATRAFHGGSTRWTLLAGLFAGLTWSCKYNGFITVAVCAGFFLHQRTAGSFFRWLAIAVIAAAIMAPWYWAIHTHHPEGIAALQKHQQGYLRGASAIWENLGLVVELRSLLPGPGLLLLCWGFVAVAIFRRARMPTLLALAALLAVEDVWFGRMLALASVVTLPLSLWAGRNWVRAPITLAFALTVLLPGIYTPYLRLWLPGEHMLLVSLAGALVALERWLRSSVPALPTFGLAALVVFVPSFLRVLPYANSQLGFPAPSGLLEASNRIPERVTSFPCDGYRMAARQVVGSAKDFDARRLATYVRPPLLYYLAASDLRVPIHRLPDEVFGESNLVSDTMIVTDVAVRDSERIRETVSERHLRSQMAKVGEFETWPHILTMLDDYASRRNLSSKDYRVKVFHYLRIQPVEK
jgi:hypothetical protein